MNPPMAPADEAETIAIIEVNATAHAIATPARETIERPQPQPAQQQPVAPYLQTWHPAVGVTYKQAYLNKVARLINPYYPVVLRPGYVIH